MRLTGSVFEAEGRQQMLAAEALQAENNLLKEELSDILRHSLDAATLDSLETLYAQLLNKDVALALLRYDIAAQYRKSPEMTKGGNTTWVLQVQQQKLRTDINSMRSEIVVLRQRLDAIRLITINA